MDNPAENLRQDGCDATLSDRHKTCGVLNLITHPVWIFDIDKKRVYWANNAALKVWNATSLTELCERDMGKDMSISVANRLRQYQSDFTSNKAVFDEQWTLYPGQVPTSLHVTFTGYLLEDGRMGMLCHARQRSIETPESIRSVEALLHTPVMITLYDSVGEPLYRNPAARASARVFGQSLTDRIVEKSGYERLMRALQEDHRMTFTLAVRTSEGEQWHELSARSCHDAVTGGDAILVSEADVSRLKRTEAQANFLALHDGLTGLPNRTQVIQRFTGAVEEVRQSGREAALIFIDLDHFKDINDTLGHAAGDELLIQVAERLRKSTRSTDIVARLGGDEFLILVESSDILGEVDLVRERVFQKLSQPATLRGTEVRVTPTIGVSLYPRDGTDLETLLRKADLAMYSGKESGRNGMVFYQEAMGAAVNKRTALESELRKALERNEFEIHYQPMVNTRTQRVTGVEALVRWRHPIQGLVAPDQFIPICESTGMIVQVGRHVFEAAARQQVSWANQGFNLKIHVNLSPRQFRDPDLVANIKRAMLVTACDPKNMGIEITESLLLGGDDHAAAVLDAISELGVSIALDDFGTGYSNLAYLQRYPIDTLKIDKSFIQSKDDERPLADLIVSLCRTLKMHVVAEGVETQEQLEWVAGRDIEHYQGYIFSKPVCANDLLALMRSVKRDGNVSPEINIGQKKLF